MVLFNSTWFGAKQLLKIQEKFWSYTSHQLTFFKKAEFFFNAKCKTDVWLRSQDVVVAFFLKKNTYGKIVIASLLWEKMLSLRHLNYYFCMCFMLSLANVWSIFPFLVYATANLWHYACQGVSFCCPSFLFFKTKGNDCLRLRMKTPNFNVSYCPTSWVLLCVGGLPQAASASIH